MTDTLESPARDVASQREATHRNAEIHSELSTLQRRELVLRPYNPLAHDAQIAALHDDCPTSFAPMNVTHVVERNGEVVGWLGLNSLPFYRLSIPVQDVSAGECIGVVRTVENQYRMAGVPVVACLFDVDCRSYPYKERLGYVEEEDWRIALKKL